MNPLVGGLGAPSSLASDYATLTGATAAAFVVLIGLTLIHGLATAYLLRAEAPQVRLQLTTLRSVLAMPLAALGLVFVLAIVRYVYRVIG